MNIIQLTGVERETIYTYNETEPNAQCFTYNKKLLNQLRQLAEDRPDDCKLLYENGDGSASYRLPKKWIKIRPNRILSEEQRKAASERLKIAKSKVQTN